MIPTSPTRVYDLANHVLALSAQTLVDNGLDLPSHRFITWHAPAWDCCDHLIVHMTNLRMTRKTTRHEQATRLPGLVAEADLTISYIGCAPLGNPTPTDIAMNANALEMYTAAWTLYQGLLCAYVDGTIVPDETCVPVRIGELQPHPPMGGCEMFTIRLTVELQ